MNIFLFDINHKNNAEAYCNKHIVKMPLEHAQMLCTAHRVLDGVETMGVSKSGRAAKRWVLPDERENLLYQVCHINHPCSVWLRESDANYEGLYNLTLALCAEYTLRYGKIMKIKSSGLLNALKNAPKNIPVGSLTPFAQAMPDDVKSPDVTDAYRAYFNKYKQRMAVWGTTLQSRPTPSWFIPEDSQCQPIPMPVLPASMSSTNTSRSQSQIAL